LATADEQLERLNHALRRLSPRLGSWLYRQARSVPFVQRRLERTYSELLASAAAGLKPYRGRATAHARLPLQGVDAASLLAEMRRLADQERERWRDGFVSGAVYHGDTEHTELLSSV
jgi:sphinganine-1-phosphate aldolase